MSRAFVLFALVGGFAAVVNVVARILFSRVVDYKLAVVLAFPIALSVAFLLNREFVFKQAQRKSVAGQYLRFGLVNVVALVQVWLVSVGLAFYVFPWLGFTWHAETVAHAFGVASPVVTSYFAHKHFSFR